jgi:hypothetical protein
VTRSKKEQREEERLMKAKKKKMMTRTHPVDMKARGSSPTTT